MHELSIASSVVDSVLEFAELHQARRIIRVRLAIGELTCVAAEQLSFCYTAITRETLLEDSTLEIETVPAEVRCPACAYAGPPKYWEDALAGAPIATLQCPACGKAAESTGGHDCAIRTIKYAAQ